jgi:hypothetical protein
MMRYLPIEKGGDMEKKTTTESTLEYEAPRIEDHGDLAELTAGRHEGEFLDAAFPAGTPKKQLTFTNP